MKKHLVVSVLGIAMLIIAASTPALHADGLKMGRNANGECCILVDGQCVPCDKMTCSTTECDPGQCKTMTPEECKSLGCEPAQCSTPGATLSSAKLTSGTACTPGSDCTPSPDCGAKARCGNGGSNMKMVQVRDAKTGAVKYYVVPVASETVELTNAETVKPGKGI